MLPRMNGHLLTFLHGHMVASATKRSSKTTSEGLYTQFRQVLQKYSGELNDVIF